LFYGGEEAWDDLLNNVQTGWEVQFDDDRRRLLVSTREDELSRGDGMLPSTEQGTFHWTRNRTVPLLTPEMKRLLQEEGAISGLEGCDTSWYV
jgi:hypothetical protein